MTQVRNASTSRRRRSVIIAMIIAAVLFMAGSFIPPLVIALNKPLATDRSVSITSEPSRALVFDAEALSEGRVPTVNAEREECRGIDVDELPHSCLVVEGDGILSRITTTSPTQKRSEADVDSLTQLTINDEVIAEYNDHLRLQRSSTFPVPEPVSEQSLLLPGLPELENPGPFIRTGLQYFFPYATERISYDYFDPLAQTPIPLDYVGQGKHNGHDSYQFHHSVQAVELSDSLARYFTQPTAPSDSPTASPIASPLSALSENERAMVDSISTHGPADRFYTPDELELFGHSPDDTVVMSPYYSVQRTVWAENRTGVLLDTHETIHVYFAADEDEAQARANAPSPMSTLLFIDTQWDEDTLAVQQEQADGIVGLLRGLQIFAYLTKAVAFFFAAWAVVSIVRSRMKGQES